ncbi:MAG: ATP-grasp domain-containing protein [Chitinophagaceae bacterium]|nr:MAG: ATP-grasp domain-containing protein [Chitinophagaceae bacterium]
MKKILLTGAGAPGGPGIIKALKLAGHLLVTSDADPHASGRALHAPFFQIPRADDAGFTDTILRLCLEQGIDVVFPLVTMELLRFAGTKEAFRERGIRVIVSDAESLTIANDKGKLYQHLQRQQIPVPPFAIANTVNELIDATTRLGYPYNPVCIKPTVSNGSRGVRVLQKEIDPFHLLFHQKPSHLFSTLEEITRILAERDFPPLLVSEYLPGMEFTVDAIVQDGVPKLILPRSRASSDCWK